MDVNEVKRALAARAEEFARFLYPDGKKDGQEWRVGTIDGGEGKSFGIHLTGAKAGWWSDFAGDVKGKNLLELWIQKESLTFREALEKAQGWLGVAKEGGVSRAAPKHYIKPSRKGITKAASRVINYLTVERGLTVETVAAFKIAQSNVHGKGDAIVFPYLDAANELEMIKFLALERDEKGKKIVWTSPGAKKGLFGKHLLSPDDRSCLITEGEVDAMTWHQLGYLAFSVPFGAKHEGKDGSDPNMEWIENDWDMLEGFERIYLSFDADDEGRLAAASIAKRLGEERCYFIEMPEGVKDANEALVAGREEELKGAYQAAKTRDPDNLKNAAAFEVAVQDMFFSPAAAAVHMGTPMMFPTNTGDFHFRIHEVTILTGINGSGKTMLLNWMLVNWIAIGKRALVGSFEVPAKQTLSYMVQQTLGKEKPADVGELGLAFRLLSEGLWFYDYVGRIDRKELMKGIIYAIRRYGVQFVIIDSFMKCGLKTDDWNGQKEFMETLTDFVKDYPVHIILVVHSRKMENERSAPGKMDIKGVGEITDMAHNVFSVHRNKQKEKDIRKLRAGGTRDEALRIDSLDLKKPDATLECLKQRNGKGEEPEWPLWFDKDTRQFHSQREEAVSLVCAEDYPLDNNTETGAISGDENEPF